MKKWIIVSLLVLLPAFVFATKTTLPPTVAEIVSSPDTLEELLTPASRQEHRVEFRYDSNNTLNTNPNLGYMFMLEEVDEQGVHHNRFHGFVVGEKAFKVPKSVCAAYITDPRKSAELLKDLNSRDPKVAAEAAEFLECEAFFLLMATANVGTHLEVYYRRQEK